MRFEEVYPAIPRFFPFFSERVCAVPQVVAEVGGRTCGI
jgi:hypothetical protein